MEQDMELRDLTDNGFTRFSIKAQDSVENHKVHEMFKEYAKTEWDNNYTLALKSLLALVTEDYKYSASMSMIDKLMQRIEILENEKVETQEEKEEQPAPVPGDDSCF